MLGEVNAGKLDVINSTILGATGVRLGAKKGALGTLNCVNGDLELGDVVVGAVSKASGVLAIEGTSRVLANSIVVAGAAKSIGTVTLKGGDTVGTSPTLTIAGALDVGGVAAGGAGTFTVGPNNSPGLGSASSGATVQAGSLSVGKAKRKGASSQVIVNGPDAPGGPRSTLAVSGAVDVGIGGPGVLLVAAGGFMSAADVQTGGGGVILLDGAEGGLDDDATSVSSHLNSTGALTIDGGTVGIFPPAAVFVAGTVTVGETSKLLSKIDVAGRGGSFSTALVAGALVVGGTGGKVLGVMALDDGNVQTGSVHVRPTGTIEGGGQIKVIGSGPAAVFRNEGLMSVRAGKAIDILGEFDLEATGLLRGAYDLLDVKDVPLLGLDSEFVKLAGTLEVRCLDFVPVSGTTFRLIEGIRPFTVTSLPAALRTRVVDNKGRLHPSHANVLTDRVDVVVD